MINTLKSIFSIKTITLLLSLSLLHSMAWAVEVNLYDDAKQDAKVVGKIDLSAGVIPIYTPKDSQWVKVADPRNGNVGWVLASELNNAQGGAVTFTQKVTNDGAGPQTYQAVQYGNNPQTGNTDMTMQRMQEQQQAILESTQKAVKNMMQDLSTIYKQQVDMLNNMGVPVTMPIPAQKQPSAGVQPVKK